MEPAKKKMNWIPSSQYHGPPINKIPKGTHKSLEQRIMFQNEKAKQEALLTQEENKAIFAENYQGSSLSMVDTIQLYAGGDSASTKASFQLFPLKTANL